MKERLREVLIRLSKKVVDAVEVYRQKGILIKVPYQKIPPKNINYEDNAFQYDFEKLENFDAYKWESKDFGEFIRTEVEALPEYAEAIAAYVAAFNYPEDGARVALDNLYRYFMNKAPNKNLQQSHIERYIDRLIDECGGDFDMLQWTIELWLGNVYIESSEIELAPNTFLRRATPEQLTHIGQHVHYYEEHERYFSNVVRSMVLLSFSIKTKRDISSVLNDPIILTEIEQWLNVLRLYGPSTVYVVRQTSTQHTLFGYQFTESKDLPGEKFLEGKVAYSDTSIHKLIIKREDEQKLIGFASHLKPYLAQTSLKRPAREQASSYNPYH